MSLLNRSTRSQLLAALDLIAVLDTFNGRTLLLQDLPTALTSMLARDEARGVDLANIVRACDAWGPAALRTLIETARDMVPGSNAAAQLQTLINALPWANSLSQAKVPVLVSLSDPPPQESVAPSDSHTPLQHQPITARVYILAAVIAFCAALFTHYLGNALVGRTNTGWVLTDQTRLEEWLIGVALCLLPALSVAWVIHRWGASWLVALIGGNTFGVALFRMMEAPMINFTPFGIDRGFIALLVSCAMITGGIMAAIFLIEQRQALINSIPPQTER